MPLVRVLASGTRVKSSLLQDAFLDMLAPTEQADQGRELDRGLSFHRMASMTLKARLILSGAAVLSITAAWLWQNQRTHPPAEVVQASRSSPIAGTVRNDNADRISDSVDKRILPDVDRPALANARNYLELPRLGGISNFPYVWERQRDGKHLIVIGTRHSRDPRSPMYDRIQALVERMRPDVILHEGVFPAELRSMPRDRAIEIGADLGFTVHLSTRHGIPLMSGDAPTKEEVAALLRHYPVEDVLVFLTAQRLIGSDCNPDMKSVVVEYPRFFEDYLVGNGLPRRQGWETWHGFLKAYERVAGNAFQGGDAWNPDLVNPASASGRLSDMARTLNAYRDAHLVATIQEALRKHDCVLVSFGSLHVLAVEPVLDDLL